MSIFNLPIDPNAIAQAICDDETLLFQNHFNGMKRSLPTITLPEIIGSNRTFQLNTVDKITCTPRRFKVVAAAPEPDIRMFINAVDPEEINLEPDMLGILDKPGSEMFGKEWDLKELQLNLDNPMILNEVITILHLRQIAKHIWRSDQLHPYFVESIAVLKYVIKALFYNEVINGDIYVEPVNFRSFGPLISTVSYHQKPVMHISRPKNATTPQWFEIDLCVQDSVSPSIKMIALLAGVVLSYCKIERALLLQEPLE